MFKDESAFEAAGLTDFCSADGDSYLLRDGIRELEFTVICCIPQEPLSDNVSNGYCNTLFYELFDYYSGTWLTAVSSTGDSSRDNNHFFAHHRQERQRRNH